MARVAQRRKLTYILEKNKHSHLLVDLDTTAAFTPFPPLEWEKKPGEKGEHIFLSPL